MTTKKEGPDKDNARPGEGSIPRRPHATLDLTATEVKTEKPAPQAATQSTSAPQPSSGATRAGNETKTEAKVAEAKAPEPKGPTKPAETATPPGSARAGAAKPEEAAAPKSASAKASGPGFGGFLTHLAAGVVGGFLALLGADTIGPKIAPQLGLPSGSAELSETTAQLHKRLTAIEQAAKDRFGISGVTQELAATQARLAKLDDLTKNVAGLVASQAALGDETRALASKIAQQGSGEADAKRLAKLEDQLATIAAAARDNPQAGPIPQIAQLSGKLADLENTLDNQLAALRKSTAEEIEARIGKVSEASETAKSGAVRIDRELSAIKVDTSRLSQRAEASTADIDRLREMLRLAEEQSGRLKSSIDSLRGDIEAQLKTFAKPAEITGAVAPVAGKLAALEQSLQSVVKAEENRKINAERIVLSLELANLKRAVDRGQSYATELAEVRKVAGSRVDLAALERFKNEGVPALVELQRSFRSVANAMIDADTEPADATIMDRLLAGAKSVVRVRKVSHSPDDTSVEAVVGRMEAALKGARIDEALGESAKLPPKAALPAQDWLTKAEARNAVDKAIGAIEGQLKASLAAGGVPAEKNTQ